jgi:hypothetical protein
MKSFEDKLVHEYGKTGYLRPNETITEIHSPSVSLFEEDRWRVDAGFLAGRRCKAGVQ